MDLAPRELPLNADPQTQLRLLDVQDKDTRLGQLMHRARTLPDAARLADIETRLARVRDEVVAAETIAADLELDQTKADQDVEQVRDRVRRDQQLLDSGSIGDPKQLQSIQHELQSLARRQVDLEDVELEIMERVEGARAAVVVLTQRRDDLEAERATVAAAVREQRAALDAERHAAAEERAELVATIPADLLALYDRIRADHGGLGAAPLHRGTCQGCHLTLPPTEIEVLRSAPADEVIRCEDCRRILVRTPESGL
jgi:predicted  nucleic acid-binding Zn-ribbon protein